MIPQERIQPYKKIAFPDFENIPEKEKNTPAYTKKVSEAIYSMFAAEGADTNRHTSNYYDFLRMFAEGRQPQSRYKEYFSGGKLNRSNIATTDKDVGDVGKGTAKKGFMNINWDILPIISNVINSVQGYFLRMDFDIKIDNIDIDSGAEQETRMLEYYTEAKYGDVIFNPLRKYAGLEQEQLDYKPGSFSEVEKLKAEGGFKSLYSTEIEKLILHTENISFWDRELKKKIVLDLITVGKSFAMAYYDHETCKVKWKHANPKYTIIQSSDANNYRSADYAGVIDIMTLSELKSLRPFLRNSKNEQPTDEDFYQICQTYRGYMDNPSEINRDKFSNEINSFYPSKYDMNFAVLRSWWIDVVNETKIEYTKKNGQLRRYEYNEKVKKLSPKEQIVRTRKRDVYQSTWIIGTDWQLDFGRMPNQPREPYYKPLIPLIGVKSSESPIVERLIPIADTFQIAWLKLQNAIAIASEDGYAVNISLLANIEDKSGRKDPYRAISIWKEKGLLFYKNPPLGMNVGGTPIPVSNLPGGLEKMFTKYLTIMDSMYRQIELVTGISPLSLGSTPPPSQAVGTAQMSLNSTSRSLAYIVDLFSNVKEQLAAVSIPMLQLAIKYDSKAREAYKEVIGAYGVEIISIAKSMGCRYGSHIVARPTDEEWGEVLNLAKLAFQRKGAETAGINEGQYIYVLTQKNSGGNLKEVALKIDSWVREDEKRIQEQKMQFINAQSEGNIKAVEANAKKLMEIEKMKLDAELQKMKQNYIYEDSLLDKRLKAKETIEKRD